MSSRLARAMEQTIYSHIFDIQNRQMGRQFTVRWKIISKRPTQSQRHPVQGMGKGPEVIQILCQDPVSLSSVSRNVICKERWS